MRKFAYLLFALVAVLVMTTPADAFIGRRSLNVQVNNVIGAGVQQTQFVQRNFAHQTNVRVNTFTTGVGSQAIFFQPAPVIFSQSAYVPSSTIVVNRGLQSGVNCGASAAIGYNGAALNSVGCGAGVGVQANINLRGGVPRQQVPRIVIR